VHSETTTFASGFKILFNRNRILHTHFWYI